MATRAFVMVLTTTPIVGNTLTDEAHGLYMNGQEFANDHVIRHGVVFFRKDTDLRLTIKVDTQGWSTKGILLLFMEPYIKGTQNSEKYIFPNITKVSVIINGSPKSQNVWAEATHFFVTENQRPL